MSKQQGQGRKNTTSKDSNANNTKKTNSSAED